MGPGHGLKLILFGRGFRDPGMFFFLLTHVSSVCFLGGETLLALGSSLWYEQFVMENLTSLLILWFQVKDCVSLLHLYLTKREIQTRRVKNKSFKGIDVRELDLIVPPPMTLF